MSDDTTALNDATNQELLVYRTIFNSTPVMIHSSDMQGKIVTVNEYWLRRMGYTADEVIGTPSTTYLTRASQEKARDLLPELIKTGIIKNIEAQAVTKSGEIIDILVGSRTVYNDIGTPIRLMTMLLDITERKEAEEVLRHRESYLTAIIENQPGLVWLKDAQGRFLAVNRAFAHSCEKKDPGELVGKTDLEVWPEALAHKYMQDDAAIIKSGTPVNIEELISDKGDQRWFETFKTPVKNSLGEIIGTTGYARDITTRKLQDEALRNVQKLESLGILAGGIAHDFNNLLAGIFGCIDLALSVSTEESVIDILTSALGVMERSQGLTQQLLTFAKGGVPIKKVESLVPFVQETAQFALSGSRASCTFNIPPDLWLCDIDKNQIGQVIDNIVINAKQAMPDGGTITIGAKNIISYETGDTAIVKPGRYVKISITDEGTGITREEQLHIFDPFFTTKEKGHGLGLSTSFSIIKRHGGTIEVASQPGKGSTFHLYLPAANITVLKPTEPAPPTVPHHGTIIVMDDEEVIRYTLDRMLQSLGYSVITTKNGNEAIDVLQNEMSADNKIKAMILDLTVPGGLGGQEAIAAIRKLDAALPVFVVSGYADNPVMASPAEYGFTNSICKPFTLKNLSALLQSVQ